MSATTPSASVRADESGDGMNPDDLSAWFRCARSRHDVEVEHELAQFEARMFERDRPVTLARHVLRRKLGAGAHGVVYEAYDPQLDRKVAIKVLRECNSTARHARFLAEARALARLAHPNVVAVHDAGLEDAGVYIVMELVEGESLEQWLATSRPWRQVLRCLIEAGRGLEAAHRAGLVHRDFKPANVLIGEAGGVKVTDFGLATPPAATSARPLGIAGTPLYMAPELRDPTRAGAASDQYAFCVTAWEALHGARGRLPRALLRHLRRGLHPDPARRWPSVEALVDRLASVARRRTRATAFVALALAFVGVLAWVMPSSSRLECTDALALADPPWTSAQRASVSEAWSVRATFERDAIARAVARLDAHVDAWTRVSRDVCEAEIDLAALACLREQRDSIRAAAELLESGEGHDPIRMVAGLGSPDACMHAARASSRWLAPPGIDAAVAEHRRTLARADVLRVAGRDPAARDLAQLVLVAATELQFPRLELEARLQLALLEEADAASVLDLVHDATARGDDDIAASALLHVAAITILSTGRHDHALAFVDLADAAVTRSDLGEAHRAAVLEKRVEVLELAHRHHDLVALYESLPESAMREGHAVHARVASALSQLGRDAEARAAAEIAYARARDAYGPSHLQTLHVQIILASTMKRDDADGAERLLRDAWARVERDIGREQPVWFAASNDLAITVQGHHGYAAAEPLWAELVPAVRERYGERSLSHALVLNNVAYGLGGAGRAREAIAIAREALAIREDNLPATHYHVAATLDNLGGALVSVGEHAEGDAALERAIAIWGQQDPPLRRLADPLTTLGRSELQQGRPADALRRLDRALAIVDASHDVGWPRSEIVLARARALQALGRHDAARDALGGVDVDDARGRPAPAGVLDDHLRWLRRAGVLP